MMTCTLGGLIIKLAIAQKEIAVNTKYKHKSIEK